MGRRALIITGIILLSLSQLIFGLVFYPVISQEVSYRLQSWRGNLYQEEPKVVAESGEFKILIPKIDIRSEVLPNVNPFDKKEYLEALKKGVAHAKGSSLPGENGNIFIFAHSTDSPFNVQNYNAIFYLVNKLSPKDAIYLTFRGKYYKYIVERTKIVSPKEINYLKSPDQKSFLTLMTCWPPGTTFKRLLVISRLAD